MGRRIPPKKKFSETEAGAAYRQYIAAKKAEGRITPEQIEVARAALDVHHQTRRLRKRPES